MMIIVRAPFRVSFFGGGTDYPEFYEKYGGGVLATTIDKYCYVSMRHLPPYFDYRNQFTYSRIERFNDPSELKHPLVRAALERVPVERVQIAYDADMPACSGIGSSSAFAVALLLGLRAMNGESPDRGELAREAIRREREVLAEAGGVQDQYEAAWGGFNRYSFTPGGVAVTPVRASEAVRKELEGNLVLMFTGFTRFSGEIAEEQKKNTESNTATLLKMNELTEEAAGLLEAGDADGFGRLLDVSWRMKRTLSDRISTASLDEEYEKALRAGALGGKIIGAGGGGFMLLYVPAKDRARFTAEMGEHRFVPFRFSDGGAEIIYRD